MAQFRVALGLVSISMIACIVQAEQEQDGIKARGDKFGEVTVEATKEACKARCAGVDTCEFWTWYYPTANGAFARRCSMYGGDITESRNNANAITGSMGDNMDQLVNPAPAPVVDPTPVVLPEPEIEIAVEPAVEVLPPPVEPVVEPEQECTFTESNKCCDGMVLGNQGRGFRGTTREACTQSCVDNVSCKSAYFNHGGNKWCVNSAETHNSVPHAFMPKKGWSYCVMEVADLCATVFSGGAPGEFYAGTSLHLIDGEENAAFPRVITNKVSGVRVAAGCRLTLYNTNDFGGEEITLEEGESNFREAVADRSFNDKASSAKCTCSPACPIGFHQIIPESLHCYAIFPGKDYEISHPEAQESCEDLGADLVSFDTEAEFKAVIAYMKGDGGQKGWWWWTALVRNEAGNFNNNGCPAYKGKSFTKKGGTDCAYLILKDEKMQAKMGKCREPRPFICEIGKEPGC